MPFIVRKISILTVVCLLLISWSEPAQSADQDLFEIYGLEVEGDIFDYLTGDFNGDGLVDIAIIYSAFNDFSTRYIGLYIHNGSSGFRAKVDHLIPLPKSASQVDAADVDGDGQPEILIIDSEGVSVIDFTGNVGLSNPVRIISQKTIFSFPLFQGILAEPFLFDVSGNSDPEIIIPVAEGYFIFERGEKGTYEILSRLSAPISCRNSSRSIGDFSYRGSSGLSISLASIHIFDGNLDGRNDLYMLWERKVCCFFQDATGNFSQTPDVELDFHPANARGYMQSLIADYNGDKRPDIAVSYTSGGMTNTETKVRFYCSDSNGRIESRFRKEITLSDSHCNLLIIDHDGDEIPDLVIPAVELGALAATKMFLMKKADLHLLIYPFRAGLPADEPARRMKYEFRLNFDDPQPTGEVAVEWSADYNGDRLHDLIFSDGRGKLKFYWGKSKDYLSKKPDLEISLDHPSEIHPVHLSKGALSDVIIKHNLSGKLDRLTVLINRNNRF